MDVQMNVGDGRFYNLHPSFRLTPPFLPSEEVEEVVEVEEAVEAKGEETCLQPTFYRACNACNGEEDACNPRVIVPITGPNQI